MVNKKMIVGVLITGCLLSVPGLSHALTQKTVDSTDSVTGWQVLQDKSPVPELKVVSGPTLRTKALQLAYKFDEGIWVAVAHNVSFSLSDLEGLRFYYKGSGASVNFKVKLMDAGGAVYGSTIPSGTMMTEWKEVLLPRSYFTYLWGGLGPEAFNWNKITRLEFTLDLDVIPGAAYSINKQRPGKLIFCNIGVVNAAGAKPAPPTSSPAPGSGAAYVPKLKTGKSGFVLIHPMSSTVGWGALADQDGQCVLSSTVMRVSSKNARVLKADFNFGSKGIWNAAVLKLEDIDFSDLKYFRFLYKGEGGTHKLTVKLGDDANTTFGHVLKTPTNAKDWTEVLIAKKDFEFLYNQSGAPKLNWNHIRKIEFTFDRQEEANNLGSVYFGPLLFK